MQCECIVQIGWQEQQQQARRIFQHVLSITFHPMGTVLSHPLLPTCFLIGLWAELVHCFIGGGLVRNVTLA